VEDDYHITKYIIWYTAYTCLRQSWTDRTWSPTHHRRSRGRCSYRSARPRQGAARRPLRGPPLQPGHRQL